MESRKLEKIRIQKIHKPLLRNMTISADNNNGLIIVWVLLVVDNLIIITWFSSIIVYPSIFWWYHYDGLTSPNSQLLLVEIYAFAAPILRFSSKLKSWRVVYVVKEKIKCVATIGYNRHNLSTLYNSSEFIVGYDISHCIFHWITIKSH